MIFKTIYLSLLSLQYIMSIGPISVTLHWQIWLTYQMWEMIHTITSREQHARMLINNKLYVYDAKIDILSTTINN